MADSSNLESETLRLTQTSTAQPSANINVYHNIQILFSKRGTEQYGQEKVTQLEHALQAALLATSENAPSTLITAALLHDIGHLLVSPAQHESRSSLDDQHEEIARKWLMRYFPDAVTEPIRLHVAAKRYLCAVDKTYAKMLSPTSYRSFLDQGGPFSLTEQKSFESELFFQQSLRLRRWDDGAKVPNEKTPPLEAFRNDVETSLSSPS